MSGASGRRVIGVGNEGLLEFSCGWALTFGVVFKNIFAFINQVPTLL